MNKCIHCQHYRGFEIGDGLCTKKPGLITRPMCKACVEFFSPKKSSDCAHCFYYMGFPDTESPSGICTCSINDKLEVSRTESCGFFRKSGMIKEKTVKKFTFYDVLTEADKARDEIVLCLLGSPGIGKTQSIYQWAKDHGRNVVEIIASQILPNEVSGITMPVNETHSMEIFDHARLSSLKDGDILFFDELLQAAPTTLSACLTLIQERRLMSGAKLPDVMVVAATNPVASPSLVQDCVRQRFMFYGYRFNPDDWKSWMKQVYQCVPTDSLISSLKYEKRQTVNGYNQLTPRTAAKLIHWFQVGDQDVVFHAVSNMFDEVIANKIKDSAVIRHEVPSIQEQIAEKLRDFRNEKQDKFGFGKDNDHTVIGLGNDLEAVTYGDLKDMNAAEMLEFLQGLSDWDEFSKVLNNLEEVE